MGESNNDFHLIFCSIISFPLGRRCKPDCDVTVHFSPLKVCTVRFRYTQTCLCQNTFFLWAKQFFCCFKFAFQVKMFVSVQKNTTGEKCLEIPWSYFHLGPLQRVFMSLPFCPVDTNTMGRGICVIIPAIQVGIVTGFVPPGSVIQLGTVSVVAIIILISS